MVIQRRVFVGKKPPSNADIFLLFKILSVFSSKSGAVPLVYGAAKVRGVWGPLGVKDNDSFTKK